MYIYMCVYISHCFASQTLCLFMQVSLGAGAKDELHVVEAEALNYEGKYVSVTLASLKMSVQPTVRILSVKI